MPTTRKPTARPATQDDVETICRICTDGWRDTYVGLRTEAEIEATICEFYDPQRIAAEIAPDEPGWSGWWVAETAEHRTTAVGAGGITEPGVGELFVLYADLQLRYQGGGSAVLEAITGRQLAQGAREQWVSVVTGNMKGIPFYEARGFTLDHERPSHHSTTGTTLRYRRPLTEQDSGELAPTPAQA